jgi:lactobin A/cerein 7B family class IIb bacteriocin
MNLENLNLVRLNAQEVQETEGGFIPLIILGILFGKIVAGATCAAAAGSRDRYSCIFEININI